MSYAVDKLVLVPDDIDLTRSPLAGHLDAETYVLGVFNPGLTRLRDAPGVTMDGQALTAWCSWALARADLLDPVLSGALASGFKLATAKAGIAPGST